MLTGARTCAEECRWRAGFSCVARVLTPFVVLRCRAWGVLARLLPNRHLLLPSQLDLRGNAQHITCLLKWSDLLPAQVVRPVALLIWTCGSLCGPNWLPRFGGLKACITSIWRWDSTPSGRTESCLRGCSKGCARGVSRQVGATPKAKTCTCTPAHARAPAAPGWTPSGIC